MKSLRITDLVGDLEYLESLGEIPDNQDELEWREKRLGMITGSNFGTLVKKEGKGFKLSTSVTAENLIYRIAWERLLKRGDVSNGLGRLNVSSQSINHGNDYEPEALHKYMESTGHKVQYVQSFVELDEWIGGTPDAFVGKEGLVEIKCPWNGGHHLKSLLEKKIYNPEHLYQIQGYLWITGRKWCDYVTYDPDLIEGLQLNIIHVQRDEAIIDGIRMVMEEVKKKIQEIINHEKLQ